MFECAAACEVTQPLESLRGAERVMQRCAMYGSSRTTSPPHTGHLAGIFHPGFGSFDADDLGDDVAGPMDHDSRADVHAFLVDLRLVMHGDVADRHAADTTA